MRICNVHFTGVTPYSQSKILDTEDLPPLEKEKPDEYDARLWIEKASFDEDGNVVIPQMAMKMAVDEAVKRLNIGIKGRGKSTYTKFFVAGQICEADIPIGVRRQDVKCVKVWANADGVRGSGKRVKRRFPYYPEWSGVARFAILDEVIPKAVFEQAVIEAGRLVGIGRFRPEKGGYLGRFIVDRCDWSEE